MNWYREKKYTYSGPGYGLPRLLSLIYLSLSRGLLNKLFYGENPPRGPTPYHFLYPILDWKGTPFVYTLHWQMVLLWIPFNCCKCTVFHKILLLALSGCFTDRNDRFSFPFIYFSKWNSYPFRCPPPPAWIFVDATRRYRRSDRWVSWPKKWNTSIWQSKNWDSGKDIPIIYYRGLSHPLP